MSVKTMSQVWELDLPTSEKFVLLAYADHTDHDGNGAYPAIARIAWKTGLSERHVQRIVKKLVDANLLEVDKRRVGKTTIYNVRCQNGAQLEPLKKPVTPDMVSPHPRHGVTPTPDMVSPEPSLEPSYNHKDSIATAKTAADDGAVDLPQDEPTTEKTQTPDEPQAPVVVESQKTDSITELLKVEEDINRRLEVAMTIDFEKRPDDLVTVTNGKNKLRKGGKSDPFYKRVESIFELFTEAAGYKRGRSIDWFVKETSYEVNDLISAWWYIRKQKGFDSCPYDTEKGPNKGLRWAINEWQKSKPVNIAQAIKAQPKPEPKPTAEEKAAMQATIEEINASGGIWRHLNNQKAG